MVRKLEQGEYGRVRLETVRKLAVVLGVATSGLMSERLRGSRLRSRSACRCCSIPG